MWLDAMIVNEPAANTPDKQMCVVAFGVALAGAGVVLLIKPELLAKLLRRWSKGDDMRLYFAQSFERSPWQAKMVGAFALLWGTLFIALGLNLMFHFTS
jgi:hypothetical protein